MSQTAHTGPAGDLAVLEEQLSRGYPLPSVRRAVAISMLTLGIAMGGAVVWSLVTKIEGAVIASGKLVAETRRKTVTLLEPGILRELLVREGTHVVPGQVLMRLDVTQAEATADQAKATYWGGLARLARLDAERRDQRTLEMPPAVLAAAQSPSIAPLVESEQRLFEARWRAYDGSVLVQQRQIAQLKAQLEAYPVQRRSTEAQLVALRRRITGYGDLARLGFSSLFQVYQLQESEAAYVSTLAGYTSQEAATLQQIAAAEAQLAGLALQRQQEVATDTQTTQATVATAEQSMRAAVDVLTRREVVASEEGVITNIQQFSPGSSIQGGQPIMDLVPANDRLVAEVSVLPTDVEQVEVGQRANVRLSSFRQHRVPLIPAHVIYIAADATPISPNSADVAYVARLALDPEAVRQNDLNLTAGMPTEGYILGQVRTAAAYLITPITGSLRRALRDY